MKTPILITLFGLMAQAGCSSKPTEGVDASVATTSSASVTAEVSKPRRPPASREGGVLVRNPTGDALYVADEDHGVIRRVAVPVDSSKQAQEIKMPGPPAQVLALADRVLVTVRDPGMLVVLKPDEGAGLVEAGRVALPDDAWGMAITADEKTVLVSSAWTHQVSAVDLEGLSKRWSVDVAREPRGIVIRSNGTAYITHLVGSELTRLDDLGATQPKVNRISLPPSPLRAPSGKVLGASLGYAATFSAAEDRLFVARHALGAMGTASWFGAATVDVLATANDTALGPQHHGNLPVKVAEPAKGMPGAADVNLPGAELTPFIQPRAMVYRKRTQTLLVAGEGNDTVVELDALSVDPTLMPITKYKVGSQYDPMIPVATSCGAPTGIALSEDESTAWVFCRSTYDLATIQLVADIAAPEEKEQVPAAIVHLADDLLSADAAKGRRIFYNATDPITSGGLACAGCHPEGRDDGYVWHEAEFDTFTSGKSVNFVGRPENVPLNEKNSAGYPRQTPMLAGRVNAKGPYGWHAESADLVARIKASLGLHRWGVGEGAEENKTARGYYLSQFIRTGLVAPPKIRRDLTDQEKKGKEVFMSEKTQCAKCHDPNTEYTDRTAYPLKQKRLPAFEEEKNNQFKTPSLLFVAGTSPYFHDGSVTTLEQLIDWNNDRMGKTNQLSKEDREALIAFLRTL